jgi:hypothetical protein
MGVLTSILPNFREVFHIAFLVIVTYYGWVFFVLGLIYMLYFEYHEEIQGQFVKSTEWVFLQILVPKENSVSTMAVESIFAQMHALHRSLTWNELYVEGKFQLWYSLEIVSLGGTVSFILRVPKRSQHLVESAFYAQYPSAEIHEVSDYMENFILDPYKKDNNYEFFGTEWKMSQDSVVPIKTYKEFEHPSAEEKVIDPLANLIETMERVKPHEFLSLQILIQPIQNDEWEARATRKIKELTGEEIPHEASILRFLLAPLHWFAGFSYKETLFGSHKAHSEQENKPRNNWLNMSEAEKGRVTLIENKINKACYNTKIRLMYIAPKNEYDKGRRFELIGALRHFSPGGGAGMHNTIKPDMRTWTKVDPYLSQALEGPILTWITNYRKHWFLRGYKNRSIYIGAPKFLLSTEELATLFHFPITFETTVAPAQVQAIASKTARPPADLPIAES